MAQQGTGNPGWPMNYDDGSGYGLPQSSDDINGFLDMNSLSQQPLDAWPPADTSSAAQDFGNEPHQDSQFSLGSHHQIHTDYANLVGGGHLAPNTTTAAAQQGWPSFQMPPQPGQSPTPGYSVPPHGTSHGYDPASQSHNFVDHTPASFRGSQGFTASSNAEALGGAPTYLPAQMGNDQWQQQQQQHHHQQLALQQQQQPQPHQQHIPQHGAMQNSGDISNYAFSGPGVQARAAIAPRPIPSPAPRQATGTPDVNRQHANSPASSGYQSPAPNWPGQAGDHGSPHAPSQHMQSMQPQQQLLQQQQQQNFKQTMQQPQIQHPQPQSLQIPLQNMTHVPQPVQSAQAQSVAQPSQASHSSSAPTKAAKGAKSAKAPKVTKPKTTTAAPKAKQASQALQAAQQGLPTQQMQLDQPAQPGHLFQQQIYLEQQHLPQQILQPTLEAGAYGQVPGQQENQILSAGANGWQQPGNLHTESQFGGHPNQGAFQQGPSENTSVTPQAWSEQQQFMQHQQQPQQSPSQRPQQPHVLQFQPPYQPQQQHHQLEQQRHLQQLQLQQQQQQQQLQQQQQQKMQARAGNAATSIHAPQHLPASHPIQQHPNQLAIKLVSGTPQSNPGSSQPLAFKPSPSPAVSKASLINTTLQAPHADPQAQSMSAIVAPPARAKTQKAAFKKAPLADVLPKPIPYLVSAADTLERQQFFPGASFLALGNFVEIEPPLTTTEPAVQPDPSKELGEKHFPGRKGSLPCEIIAEYDRLVSSQPPEKKEALILELRSKLKSQGKILPPKVYKFASLGDQPKKATKIAVQGPATMDSPDSADEEEEEEEVRSAVRPADPADAAAWDAIGFVHVTDNGPTTIKRAVKNFGDFIKRIYDGIKETKERLKKAEESSAKKEAVEQLKRVLASKQELLYRAVDAADEKGHEQVLENLGGNGPLVANLVSALRDCVNASDFNGKLSKTLLRFMSQFTTVTDEMLNQKLKFDKIQKRFMTKGDDEVKGLVGEIVSKTIHAKPTAPAASAGTGTTQGVDSAARASKPASRVPSDSLSSKRPREDESDSRSTKKIATNSASGAPQPVSKPTLSSGVTSMTAAPAKPWAGTALLPGKSRPVTKPPATKADSSSATTKADSATKEVGKLSSTSSPSKRETTIADTSSTTTAAATTAAATAAARAKKAAAAKTDPSSSSLASQSKLGALLEEISKPKSAAPATPTPDSSSESVSSSETPEERAKRLRKESRRKLRVSWKSGNELTEVRVFTKDKGEDEGRAKYLLRDAGDDRSEGLALKRSLKKGANTNLEDEDEDGGSMSIDEEEDELPYRPWFEPSAIDFSLLVDKRAQTFATRGGNMAVDTAEQKIMAERENTVLMAIYTDPSDVPPTPKSPVHGYSEVVGPKGIALPATDAKLQELQVRWNEERTYGADWAVWNAIKRVETLKQQQPSRVSAAQPGGAISDTKYDPTVSATKPGEITSFIGPRAGEVIRLLTSDSVKNWKPTLDLSKSHTYRWQDYADPAVQKAVLALEGALQHLKFKPFPATEPPEYIADPERIKEWWTGYNREKQRERAQAEAEAEAQRLAAQAVPQQAGQAGQPQDAATAWAAYYAQINQQQQQQQQVAQPTDANAYAQYLNAYYQQQQQAQVQAAPQSNSTTDTNAQLQALLATLGGTAQQPAQQAAAPQNDAQLQAILASMAGAGSNAQQPGPQYPNTGADQNQAFMLSLAQWAAGQQQQSADQAGSGNATSGSTMGTATSIGPTHNPHQPESTRSGNGNSNGNGNGPHSRNKRDRDTQDASVPSHLRGINRALIGTKACVFWSSGKCAKGDKCTFRHD